MRMRGVIATEINKLTIFRRMAWPREREAVEYLEKHKIADLMDNLSSMLLFNRPECPREFLIDKLEKLKVSKDCSGYSPCLFNESNLDALFGILDPAHQGYITSSQYKEALKMLGIKNFNELLEKAGDDKISQETFIRDVKEGLATNAATFQTSGI